MAIVAPVLATYTLPLPNRYRQMFGYRGGTSIMADGTLSTDLVSTSTKLRWEMGWDWLTQAQCVTLQNAFGSIKNASGAFTDVDNGSYTVTLDDGFLELEFEMKKIAGNNQRYAATIKLRQV